MRERVKKHELFNRTNWTRSTQCDLIFVHYLLNFLNSLWWTISALLISYLIIITC
jgi:hypothetical protein